MADHLDGWPCHKKARDQWCDHSSPGGFMGHTCGNECDDDYRKRLLTNSFNMDDLDRNALLNTRAGLDVIGIKYHLPRMGTVSCISCLKHKPYSQIKLALSDTLLVCDECDGHIVNETEEDKMNQEQPKIKRPDEALAALGELFRSRNAVYGSTYKDFGAVMLALIPGETTIKTEEDWNRLAIFFHCADKLARYGRQFKNGGHRDSLDDVSVYAQLLQECDEELRQKKGKSWPPINADVIRPVGDVIVSSQLMTFSNPTPSEEELPTVGKTSLHPVHDEYYWVKYVGGVRPVVAQFRSVDARQSFFRYSGGEIPLGAVDILSWVERPQS